MQDIIERGKKMPNYNPAQTYYKGKVTGGSLKLRATPNGNQIAIIPNNKELAVVAQGNGWAQTIYGMNEGYVMEYYLTNQGTIEYYQYLFGLNNLYRGCSNSLYVSNLQDKLVSKGFLDNSNNDAIDGVFGVNTENAVKDFQREYHLTVDGIVGNATKEALDTSSPW